MVREYVYNLMNFHKKKSLQNYRIQITVFTNFSLSSKVQLEHGGKVNMLCLHKTAVDLQKKFNKAEITFSVPYLSKILEIK